MQVRSLAGHSGLRIPGYCSFGLGRNYGWDLIPGPGTLYASGGLKQGKKKKFERKNKIFLLFKGTAKLLE